MGNKQSSRPLENVTLVSQSHEPVVLHPDARPLVLLDATKLRVEKVNGVLSVFDHATGELLFRYNENYFPDWTDKMLVDGSNQPVVMMRKEDQFRNNCLIKFRDEPHKLLYKIRAWKIDMSQTVHVHSEVLRASGEKLLVDIEGSRVLHKAVMWVKHNKSSCEAIGTITGITGATNDTFEGLDIDVAAGVDLTVVALFCILLHDVMTTNSNVPNLFLGV